MTEWVWTFSNFIRGKGQLKTSSGIFSSDMIELLNFSINGKFSTQAEVSEYLTTIIDEDIESWKAKKKFLAAGMLEIIIRALWKIKIRTIKSIRMNDIPFANDDYFYGVCQRVHDGELIISLNATIVSNQQQVKLNFKFRDKKVRGEIVFKEPISERSANKFAEQLTKLETLFKQKGEKPKPAKSKKSQDHHFIHGSRLDRDVARLESCDMDDYYQR
jgi:hypothetical protein